MRKRKVVKFSTAPDPKFGDVSVASFVNNLMLDGKKPVAYRIFYSALEAVGQRAESAGIELSPLDVWRRALDHVSPKVEVRSKRVGGATLQIPVPVRESRSVSLGMKWLIRYARKRNEKSMEERLSSEIMAAYNEEGGAVKKRTDVYKMAEANKAFSHFNR